MIEQIIFHGHSFFIFEGNKNFPRPFFLPSYYLLQYSFVATADRKVYRFERLSHCRLVTQAAKFLSK